MIFKSWLQELSQFDLIIIFSFFLIQNALIVIFSIIIGKIVESENTVLQKKDFKWVISTLLCNTLITFLGYEMYQLGIIKIDFSSSLTSVLFNTLILVVIMDFLMFSFHYLIHQFKWFYPIHKLHHTHIETSVYSLFILHPIETIGFGLLWLLLLSTSTFSYLSIIIYLILNLLYGIFGHLKKDVFPSFWDKNMVTKWISNTKFHNNHHQNESHNYGFYFTIWDKIFKTNI